MCGLCGKFCKNLIKFQQKGQRMKYHFNTFGRDKSYKGCLRRFEFDTLDEAVKAADKLAKTRIQIVVLDEATMPIYRTGKWYVKNGLKGEFYEKRGKNEKATNA